MPSTLAIIAPAVPSTVLEAEAASAHKYALAEKSAASRRAYRSDFRHFAAWCAERNLSPMPATAETVCAYLAALADAGMKTSTIGRRCAAVRHAHRLAGAEPPTGLEVVKVVMRGIRRTIGAAPERKAALTADRIGLMIDAIPPTGLINLRDRALLLIGFAAALRRSELVALDVADLEECNEGLRVRVARSKTDQEAAGATIAIPRGHRLRPVQAVQDWLQAAKIAEGAIFRSVRKGGRAQADRLSDRAVAMIVKARAEAAGLDPAQFSGHSLRAGFITSAAAHGASVFKMQAVSRHKTLDVLSGYVRDAEAFKSHAGEGFL